MGNKIKENSQKIMFFDGENVKLRNEVVKLNDVQIEVVLSVLYLDEE